MSISGWVTPKKEFIKCPVFSHIETLKTNPVLQAYVPQYDTLMHELEEIAADRNAASDANEHPEWHIYEMAKSDANWEIVEALYDAGCLRVGETGLGDVHLHGRPEAYLQLKDFCRETFGKDVVFTPRKKV